MESKTFAAETMRSGMPSDSDEGGGVGTEPSESETRTAAANGPLMVGANWSDTAQHALRWVATQARALDVPVIMVHAISPWLGFEMAIPPFNFDEYREVVSQSTEQWAITLNGLPHESKVIEDDPAHALLMAASKVKPSLIAVGSHSARKWHPPVLGSVTSKLLHATESPVVVVPKTASTNLDKSILVGVDGSPSSLRALNWSAQWAKRLGVSVQAVCAYPLDAYAEKPRLAAAESDAPLDETTSKLRGLSIQVSRETGADISSYLLVGHPKERLIQVGENSAAVVVGKAGHNSFPESSLGSTSRTVATHSKVPVIVVP